MINTNGLRIGNLFIDKLTGAYLKVSELGRENKIVFDVVDRAKFPLPDGWQALPIELTPETLENCGFKYEGATTLQIPDFPVYFKIHEGFKPQSFYFYLNGVLCIKCSFLHQLQNLYFDFFGEEIKIRKLITQ